MFHALREQKIAMVALISKCPNDYDICSKCKKEMRDCTCCDDHAWTIISVGKKKPTYDDVYDEGTWRYFQANISK